jgi:uncharacterized protein YqeY
MIKENLNKMIMESMKAHDAVRTETLRAIKNAFMNWETSKEHAGQELTEADEIQIIKKLVKQREESVEQFMSAGREELANEEHKQMVVLKEFLPADATEEDILKCFNDVIGQDGVEPIKKNMGVIIKMIKEFLPNADGKLVAQIVQKYLQ